MIRLLTPIALGGLVLALGPLLIHLLRRRRARTLIVPTVRFVPLVTQSSMRLRPPDDLWLLAVRILTIMAAAVALAAPLLLTGSRRDAWNGRVARAVVIDSSRSVDAVQREERAQDELASAFTSIRIETASLPEGLRRAASWLETVPPARQEVVVISDFQHGTLSSAVFDAIPRTAGLRFAPIASTMSSTPIDDGLELVEGQIFERRTSLENWSTSLTLTPSRESAPGLRIEGVAPEVAARLSRVVLRGGAYSPRSGATIVRFGATANALPVATPAAEAAVRLAADARVAEIPFGVAVEGESLVVSTRIDPESLDAAILVQASLDAWHSTAQLAENEVQRISDTMLQSWSRPAEPADLDAWRRSERSDGRWLWLAALILLIVEWRIRRRRVPAEEAHVRAA